MGLPPPYWAFAWAGGQALARYVLDNAHTVAGKRVLDLAAGSGLVGDRGRQGRRRAGHRRRHRCVHRSRRSRSTPRRTASTSTSSILDLLDHPAPAEPRYDVILVGDLFYERDTAARALAFLDRHAAIGTRVLIGDPGRTYLPKDRLHAARRIFRAGDARAGGSGDQADDGVGVAYTLRLVLRQPRSGSRRIGQPGVCGILRMLAIARRSGVHALTRLAPQDDDREDTP